MKKNYQNSLAQNPVAGLRVKASYSAQSLESSSMALPSFVQTMSAFWMA